MPFERPTIPPVRYPSAKKVSIPRNLPVLGAQPWLAWILPHLLLLGVWAGAQPPDSSSSLPGPRSIATTLDLGLFERSNLVAWCIVPFDARKRGPEERAEMMRRLGFTHFAYDWRAEHIPTFDEELDTLDRWEIELSAFWFPSGLNEEARTILDLLKRHQCRTELWVSLNGGDIETTPEDQERKVAAQVEILRPLADAAAEIGCKIGLYNHGGWFGEPENQIEILKRLGKSNVGLVYNLHHGHRHLDRFPELLQAMKPYLLALNLNGMDPQGETNGNKILPLGQGERDLEILRTIAQSGYRGPIGILGHTEDDAEATLRDNLDGLDWLLAQLRGDTQVPPRPVPRTRKTRQGKAVPSIDTRFGKALTGGLLLEGKSEYRSAPLTLECRVRLHSQGQYNILVASDTKASGAHWEVFTEAGSGFLSLYTPGVEPDHLRTDRNLCDGNWHRVGMHLDLDKASLFLDGVEVASHPIRWTGKPAIPGGLAFGRLVEGGFGCDGELDDIRISRGLRALPPGDDGPLIDDETTLGHWSFEDLSSADAISEGLEVEDPARRAELPEFQVIEAAAADELTPALRVPDLALFRGWSRSHGDSGNSRFSGLSEINRDNVAQLEVAWTYHSKDATGNIQCNPVIVEGVLFAPTSGENVVAIDAKTGVEKWRFDPDGRPAWRGLVYWKGSAEISPRLFVNAGKDLWALDPASGLPIESFGEKGKVVTGEVRVAGAVYRNVLVVPGFEKDVFGYDARTGEKLWTFHTIPVEGEFGYDTWRDPEKGANCWGGMAMDEGRGIAYISTGSPKPDFIGTGHHGQNLFANCLIALDALTGKRLWHFQEIRHDIWDLDIPAPPNLVSVLREGKRVDAVAQVTKIGNTLLLDRVTGKPLFPFRLRRAPVSALPGERTWPYQPDVELPQPFAQQVYTPDNITDIDELSEETVRSQVASASHGWFQPLQENRATVFFGVHGGAEWTGASVDPIRGRLYVSSNELPWSITVFQGEQVTRDPNAPPTPGQKVYEQHCTQCHGPDRAGIGMVPPLQGLARRYTDAQVVELLRTGRNSMPAAATLTEVDRTVLLDFLFLRDIDPRFLRESDPEAPNYTFNGYNKVLDPEGFPGSKPPWGTLNCIDLNTGRLTWKVPLGVYPALEVDGFSDTGAENFGGAMATAGGLVFCAGTPDQRIRAFDSDTGEILWEHSLPWGGYAPPASYEVEGRQYIVIAATGGGKLGGPMGDAWVAFGLSGEGR